MFCEYCGKKLNDNETCDCAESMENQKTNESLKINNLKLSKTAVLIVASVLVVAVVIGLLVSMGKEKINLADYLITEPSITGLDGNGTIDMSDLFDDSALKNDLIAGLSTQDTDDVSNMSDEEIAGVLTEGFEAYSECEKAVKDIVITVWKNGEEVQELTGLSNGDVIKVKASSLNSNNDYFNKEIKAGTVEFTIEGLMEGKPVATFENTGLKVSFVGVNGSGIVHLDYNPDAMPDVHVEFEVKDDTRSWSNGDKVEIVVRYDEYTWEQKGYYPLEESRIYTVEGLVSYVTSMDDITDSELEEIKSAAETKIRKDAEGKWRDEISIENISYVGNCLLIKHNDAVFYGPETLLYLVYKVDVFENFSSNGGDDNHFSYYTYGLYEGLLTDKEGKLDLNNVSVSSCWEEFGREIKMSSSPFFGSSYVYYNGYETVDEFLKKNVNDYVDKYLCVSTINVTE